MSFTVDGLDFDDEGFVDDENVVDEDGTIPVTPDGHGTNESPVNTD